MVSTNPCRLFSLLTSPTTAEDELQRGTTLNQTRVSAPLLRFRVHGSVSRSRILPLCPGGAPRLS